MIYFLLVLLILLIFSNIFFIKKSYEFGKTILEIQDALEVSLNILNEKVESVSKILEIPLFFDSLEIRKVCEDVRTARDSIKKVAETFSIIEEEEAIEDDDR